MRKSPIKKIIFIFSKLAFAGFIFLFTNSLFSQTAPVVTPKGGFKIDGKLRANVSTAFGDWSPRLNSQAFTAGVDSFVLDASGNPKDAVTTRLSRDEFNNTIDDIFTQGSKFNDYISALRWGLGGAPNKNDIHNGVFHASSDPSGNQWVFIGGDRSEVTGTSYIDFQFLQGTVIPNAAAGTFAGSGLAGGRVIGDINVSMEYNNGGTTPKVVIYRWAPTNEAGTAWGWDSTGSAAITQAFANTNLVNTDVPFGAFGGTTYQPFAFVEAGINVTQLISAAGGNCSGLSIKTLWITTKASSSSTAALKDFMTPISLDLTFGGVTIDSKEPFCVNASAITLTGNPSGGTFTGPGTSGANGATFTPASAGVGTHTIVYEASAGANCTKTTSTQIIVRALPTASISGSTTVCKDATAPFVVIQGSGGTKPYTFSYNIGGGSTLQRTTTGTFDTVRVIVPTGTAGSFVYNLLSVSESSSTTCSQNQTGSATVIINPKPSASISGATSVCKDATSPFIVLTGSGGTRPYTFSYTINGGGTLTRTTTGSFDTARVNVPTGTAGTFTYALTGVSDPNCSNTASGSAAVIVTPKPTAGIAGATTVCKDATAPFVVFTGSGGTRPYTFSYTLNGGGTLTRTTNGSFDTARIAVPTGTPGTFTYVLTGVSDANCSNTASGSEAVTVNSVPTAPTICVIQPSLCGPATGSIKVISPLVAGYQYSKDDGQTWQDCNVFLNVVAGSNPIIRYKTTGGCVSASATCGQATCTEAPVACVGGNFSSRAATQEITEVEASALKVKAYPNPFSDKIKFVITSPMSGDGSLDVYNMMGQRVKTIYTGFIAEGTQIFELSLSTKQVANLVYVLRIGNKKMTGKILQINQ